MKYFAVLVCLGAVVALPADDMLLKRDEMPIKMDEMLLKKEEMPIKRDEMLLKKEEMPIKMDEMLLKKEEMPIKMDEMLLKKEEMPIKTAEILLKKLELPIKRAEMLLKKVELPIKRDDMMLTDDMTDVPTGALAPKRSVRPDIAASFNEDKELMLWNSEKYAEPLTIENENGMPENVTIAKPSASFFSSAALIARHVNFHYFNKYDPKDVKGKQIMSIEDLKSAGWNPQNDVKVIIHGFINSVGSDAIQKIKNAYLKSGAHNVIGVSWGFLAHTGYALARNNVPGVGTRVGEFLDALLDANLTTLHNVHIIGHSLGAHIAGIAGKSMLSGSVARITGLDPAGPLFRGTPLVGRLHSTDALFVDAIHTNARRWGLADTSGDVDFYVNGGRIQPQCVAAPVAGLYADTCSHLLAYDYFASSIDGKKYEAVHCSELPADPDKCAPLVTGGRGAALPGTHLKAVMGDKLSFVKLGAHYLEYKDRVIV